MRLFFAQIHTHAHTRVIMSLPILFMFFYLIQVNGQEWRFDCLVTGVYRLVPSKCMSVSAEPGFRYVAI